MLFLMMSLKMLCVLWLQTLIELRCETSDVQACALEPPCYAVSHINIVPKFKRELWKMIKQK